MRSAIFLFLLVSGIVLADGARAVDAQGAGPSTSPGVSGRWVVVADFYGSPLYFQLELKEGAGQITGNFDGDKLEGTVNGNSIHFVAKDAQGGTEECTATVKDSAMSGTIVFTDAGDAEHACVHGEPCANARGGGSATPRIHADNFL
jgi:amidase